MQTVDSTMASGRMLRTGKYHLAALDGDKETKGLATAFRPTLDALALAKAKREAADDALIAPRAAARFTEADLEVVLGEIAGQAHDCDRKASGDLVFRALFPDGLDPEVRSRGAAQLAASTALRGRLDSQPAAAPVKAAMLAELDRAIAALAGALEARGKADHALGLARAAEDGARETFVSSYDSNAGAIRQMFPRNRPCQDLYFDQYRLASGASDDQPEPAPSPSPKQT